MKVLFVDNSSDLQQKWIEPLRKKGWGVVRARSAEDATRMMNLHADSLEAIAVNEKLVAWAEKQTLPFVVLTAQWGKAETSKHKSGPRAAVNYISLASGMEEMFSFFESPQEEQALKMTGTDNFSHDTPTGSIRSGILLENYSEVLARPETITNLKAGGATLQLQAPSVVLGGASIDSVREEEEAMAAAAPIEEVSEVHEMELAPIQLAPILEDDGNRTVLLESTRFDVDTTESGLDLNQPNEVSEEISLSFDPIPEEASEVEIPIHRAPPPPPSYSASSQLSQFAINPSPSAQISDLGTLKSYLALREQDVAVLTGQVRSSQERIQQLEVLLKMEKARSTELNHLVSKQEQKIQHYDQDKQVELEVLEKQADDLSQQLKDRTDKVRLIETKLKFTTDEVNKIKDRVRVDIRRIRVREKELESQLEILKKDSAALLQARDEKIIELKRKVDLLEFNMELVQEQYSRERQASDDLKSRLKDAAQVMKQANGLLEQ